MHKVADQVIKICSPPPMNSVPTFFYDHGSKCTGIFLSDFSLVSSASGLYNIVRLLSFKSTQTSPFAQP